MIIRGICYANIVEQSVQTGLVLWNPGTLCFYFRVVDNVGAARGFCPFLYASLAAKSS